MALFACLATSYSETGARGKCNLPALTAISQKQHLLISKGSDILHSDYFELIACLSTHKLRLSKMMKQSSYLLYINLFWYLVATLWVTFLLWLKHWALHKQFGSVIFHKKCDFVKALSTALEKAQSIKGNWKPLHLQVQACQSLLLHLLWKKRSMKGLCILMQSFMIKPMYWSLSFMTVHQHTAI